MNKTEFKKAMIIEPISMIGDRLNNEDVDYFLDGVKQSALSRKVQDYIVHCTENARWTHNIFTKGELRWLNSMCKAKSEATRLKRQKAFISLMLKPHYGHLFNKHKIAGFLNMVEDFTQES